jgi:protein CpxP
MKPYILLAFILIGTLSFAQPSKRGRETPPPPPMSKMKEMSAENSATLMSKKMTLQLDLSETQQAKVYDLILESTIEKKAQRANHPDGKPSKEMRFEKQNKMLDDKIAFSKSMKSILSETQYSLWKEQSYKKKKKPKRP